MVLMSLRTSTIQDDCVYTGLPFTSTKWLFFVIRWGFVVTCSCIIHSASTLHKVKLNEVCVQYYVNSIKIRKGHIAMIRDFNCWFGYYV